MIANWLIRKVVQGQDPQSVIESVDNVQHADAILKAFHYVKDPRYKEGKSVVENWYNHDDGHSVFVWFDPSRGFGWHHYEATKTGPSIGTKKNYNFRKGFGTVNLNDFLTSFHTAQR